MELSNSLTVFSSGRLPRRPLCTSDFKIHGCWRKNQTVALTEPYIQINPPGTNLWMIFDVDRPGGALEWESEGLPQPAWSCTTRSNGHGHLAYALEMPVRGKNLANKAVRYFEAIKEGYRSRLRADAGYAGVLTKNPIHREWLVEPGHQKLWMLSDLADYVELPSTRTLILRDQELGGLGRNVDTFDRLRFWAYGAVGGYRKRDRGFSSWFEAVDEKVYQFDQLNSPSLSCGELKHIVRSVANWVWFKYGGTGGAFNQLASDLGKLGGRPRTTTLHGTPWDAENISRATWYRQQKCNRQTSDN